MIDMLIDRYLKVYAAGTGTRGGNSRQWHITPSLVLLSRPSSDTAHDAA